MHALLPRSSGSPREPDSLPAVSNRAPEGLPRAASDGAGASGAGGEADEPSRPEVGAAQRARTSPPAAERPGERPPWPPDAASSFLTCVWLETCVSPPERAGGVPHCQQQFSGDAEHGCRSALPQSSVTSLTLSATSHTHAQLLTTRNVQSQQKSDGCCVSPTS